MLAVVLAITTETGAAAATAKLGPARPAVWDQVGRVLFTCIALGRRAVLEPADDKPR